MEEKEREEKVLKSGCVDDDDEASRAHGNMEKQS